MSLCFYLDESPRQPKVAVSGKHDQGVKQEYNKQEVKGSTPKLPPKPQGQNLNYKLPPKPSMGQYEPPRPESKQESKKNIEVNKSKPTSSSGSRPNRSSSMQRVIYPSWWG